MKTAVAGDAFSVSETHIVYGAKGFAVVDETTAKALLNASAVRRVKSTSASGWQTHIYCAMNGVLPDE